MNPQAHILLVDDEPAFQRLCGEWLCSLGYTVAIAATQEQALQRWQAEAFDLVLLDLALPPSLMPEEGLAVLQQIRQSDHASVPVVVMTGHADNAMALKAIELGAWDFLAKPVDPALLQVVMSRALIKRRLELEVAQLRQEQQPATGLVGDSASLKALRQMIRRIAPATLSVLVTGPSGTGKELVARAIHQLSGRTGMLVPVHGAAMAPELLESELFGHVKGAFTSAHQDRVGLVALASGGTLFLDEIGDMPLTMQVKLLRFLQEGTYYAVGSSEEQKTDVRIVAATHRDLLRMVEAGSFREDLYYRLKGIELKTTGLKARVEDIPILVTRFVGDRHRVVEQPVLHWLICQDWPGNVRELYNVLDCAVSLCQSGESIALDDVIWAKGETASSTDVTDSADLSLDVQLQTLEKNLIVSALAATGRNHTHSAKRLGISRAG